MRPTTSKRSTKWRGRGEDKTTTSDEMYSVFSKRLLEQSAHQADRDLDYLYPIAVVMISCVQDLRSADPRLETCARSFRSSGCHRA